MLKPAPLDGKTREDTDELSRLLKGNLEKVVQHGKRADSIVKNMLLHSREGAGERRPADINALVGESLNLAYHGARADNQDFRIRLDQDFDPAAGEADVLPQEITRVLLNLISNGFYAAMKRKAEDGANGYEPALTAITKNLGDRVEIRIRDNGSGIAPDVKAKMFNPFFTTKATGRRHGPRPLAEPRYRGQAAFRLDRGRYEPGRIHRIPRCAAEGGGKLTRETSKSSNFQEFKLPRVQTSKSSNFHEFKGRHRRYRLRFAGSAGRRSMP